MKRMLAISMRVAADPSTAEPRDAIARDWWRFFEEVLPGTPPLLLPNAPALVTALLEAADPCGLILTGGNDVGSCPERDESEALALDWMTAKGRPVLGVCRGMQFLVQKEGGVLQPGSRQGHVATRHLLSIDPTALPSFVAGSPPSEVNSYHGFQALLKAGSRLKSWARAGDGTLEGVYCQTPPLLGIMWHPEREAECHPFDKALVAGFFAREGR